MPYCSGLARSMTRGDVTCSWFLNSLASAYYLTCFSLKQNWDWLGLLSEIKNATFLESPTFTFKEGILT